MARIIISPSKYIQGPGELEHLGEYAERYGRRALVLISAGGYLRMGSGLEQAFENRVCDLVFDIFRGECCRQEIRRVQQAIFDEKCDLVIGIGGGKVIDTAKMAAHYSGCPLLICPTIAASDAPCSSVAVIYSPEGVVEGYEFLPRNPHMVIMDTTVIAASPLRLTISGIGDALATYFEARACMSSGALSCAGGRPTRAAMAMAHMCYDTLMESGRNAKRDLEEGRVTEDVEAIIEANTLLSGLGFESGGLAAAHAIHNGITIIPETHSRYHGEKVAFGTITQLFLEHACDAEIRRVVDLCTDLGLPITLRELGVEHVTDEMLEAAATAACAPEDTMGNMPFPVSVPMVVAAMKAANAYGETIIRMKD